MQVRTVWHHNASGHQFGFFEAVDLIAGRSRIIRALSESQLRRLIEERGIGIVRTAFDRTHIAGALAETGMIIREEDGHYVLDGELEKILFDLEDMSTSKQLWVTTIEELGQRLQGNTLVHMRPAPDGAVTITNTGDAPISDWSAAFPGSTITVNGKPPNGTRSDSAQNVAWFDLAPGSPVTVHSLNENGDVIHAAEPVNRIFSDAADLTQP